MIAQPSHSTIANSPLNLEEEVLQLRADVAELQTRLSRLEAAGAPSMPSETAHATAGVRPLFAMDSPEMNFAFQLCAEVFPGSTTEVDVECDPSEPEWPWYSLMVHWKGEVRDSVDRQLAWHEKMSAAFPHVLDEFRIFVDLQ
jgi:hypothetical protein